MWIASRDYQQNPQVLYTILIVHKLLTVYQKYYPQSMGSLIWIVFLENNQMTFSATDLELGITCVQPVQVIEEGHAVIPAHFFAEIVRRLPNTFKINNTVIAANSQHIFTIVLQNAADFI